MVALNERAFQVELLPAAMGDAILISAPVDAREWRLLIDTGPKSRRVRAAVEARLGQLRSYADDCNVDLFVVTHYDDDHIGNAARLLTGPEQPDQAANRPVLRPRQA